MLYWSMRVFFVICILLGNFSSGLAQVDEEALIGHWIPVSYEQGPGFHDVFVNMGNVLLKFDTNENGSFELLGVPDGSWLFTYELKLDSIRLSSEEFNFKYLNISHFNTESFVANFDGGASVIYQRLAPGSYVSPLEQYEELIAEKFWLITMDGLKDPEGYRFEPHAYLKDTSLFKPTSIPSLRSSAPHPGQGSSELLYWSIAIHHNQLFIKFHSPFGFWPFDCDFALIEEIGPGKIKFKSWNKGQPYYFTARQKKPLSAEKQARELKWLTDHPWRIFAEKEQPPIDSSQYIFLGPLLDEIEPWIPEDFIHDSTLVISREDLDEKKLILHFHKDGVYQIKRNERILDEGTWRSYYDNTEVVLSSKRDKEKSDGVTGGYLNIIKLRKNKLILTSTINQAVGKNTRILVRKYRFKNQSKTPSWCQAFQSPLPKAQTQILPRPSPSWP